MAEKSVEERVLSLHSEGKWQSIINLGTNDNDDEGRRLLWVWPSIKDLCWIKSIIEDYRLEGIVSIGCGSGLLEWIIQQYSGCNVIGIEADKRWWSSGYSPPLFLNNIIFIDDKDTNVKVPKNYALLFCYFFNGRAFYDYMMDYEGSVIMIIGPDEGQDRTTDPLPFDTKLEELGWTLQDSRKLDNGKDFATVFTR